MRNLPAPSCHSVDRGGFRRNWISILSDQRPIHHTSLAYYWICKYWQLYYFQGVLFFYWYIQPCWCEYMFISLSIIKIRKDSFDSIISRYALLSSEISGWWHLTLKPSNFGEASSISIFARLGLSPKATDQIAKPCVILNNSRLAGCDWIHFIQMMRMFKMFVVMMGREKWRFSLWANSLAAEMKG